MSVSMRAERSPNGEHGINDTKGVSEAHRESPKRPTFMPHRPRRVAESLVLDEQRCDERTDQA